MTLPANEIEATGKLLYGDVWQTNLARALGVDSRLVRQWCAGERIMHYAVYKQVVALLSEKQQAIGEHLIHLEDWQSQIDRCLLAKDIDSLCDALNEYEGDFDPDLGKPTDLLDYNKLPVFGQTPPTMIEAVASYSDTHILVNDGKWRVMARI